MPEISRRHYDPPTDPDRVVKQILRSARRPRSETTVGPTGYLLRWAHAGTPKLYDFLVPYVFDLGGFRAEPAEQGPGNVFEPMPEWNQVTGGWRGKKSALLRGSVLAGGAALAPVGYWLIRLRNNG